ncbi:MAG: N-acetylmuramoyl-L-alanine amidase [Ghiorsea sp.]|nr:N-acetylmuramoyl-L-alanine amidase [Ghiorsea sp.]
MKELAKKRVYHSPIPLFAFAFYAFLFFSATPALAYTHINDVRIWTAPDHTRLVFDLSQSTAYKIFRLHNPERIVIDIANSKMQAKPASLALPDPVLLSIRHGKQRNGVTRIVLDVKKNVSPRSFLLKKSSKKPYRLVVDLIPKQKAVFKTKDIAKKGKHRDIIIAVDAGHGGEDPGATGKNKLKEKTVTLAVAKQLARLINAKPGMKAILIRSGDYYVALKKRVRKVRAINADMMISIHADAVTTRTVKGASVYTLSENGATPDRVAAALAAKENSVDEIGGAIPSVVTDPLVRGILGDMAKRDGLDSSEMLANLMIKKLTMGKFPIKYSKPKHARFAVLTTLEIPCILVEMDYISNPKRERLLKSKFHQKKLAKAMYSASVDFFTRMGRLSPHKATAHTHTVHQGESLWSIAKQYGVSVFSLKKLNQFKHSTLKVGQRIRLPQS